MAKEADIQNLPTIANVTDSQFKSKMKQDIEANFSIYNTIQFVNLYIDLYI